MKKSNKYILYFLSLSLIFSAAIYFSIPSESYIYQKIVDKKDLLFSRDYLLVNKNLDFVGNDNEIKAGILQQINHLGYKKNNYVLYIFIHSLISPSNPNQELIEYQFRLHNIKKDTYEDYVNAYFIDTSQIGEIFNEKFKFNEFNMTLKLIRKKTKANYKIEVDMVVYGFKNKINLKKTVDYSYKNSKVLKNYLLIDYDKKSQKYYIPNNFQEELF